MKTKTKTKTKIEDLTDEQLDHFCAIAQGWKIKESESGTYWNNGKKHLYAITGIIGDKYHPTTSAAQCMEIQEREKISVNYHNACIATIDKKTGGVFKGTGATAKQAIIRCFVKSKLGKKVDCETI